VDRTDGIVTPALDFTLVLAGGGARGFAHVGVLRALEAAGLRPSGIVGVSMGAVVATTYALNPDWYQRLVSMDTEIFQGPGALRRAPGGHLLRRVMAGLGSARDMWRLTHGWGVAQGVQPAASSLLRSLTRDGNLEEGRVPVVVCATDLRSGMRCLGFTPPIVTTETAPPAISHPSLDVTKDEGRRE